VELLLGPPKTVSWCPASIVRKRLPEQVCLEEATKCGQWFCWCPGRHFMSAGRRLEKVSSFTVFSWCYWLTELKIHWLLNILCKWHQLVTNKDLQSTRTTEYIRMLSHFGAITTCDGQLDRQTAISIAAIQAHVRHTTRFSNFVVAQLCLFKCQLLIFVTVWMIDKSTEATNKALLIIMSSSVSLEAQFVWWLFVDGKLTVASATLSSNKVARQSCWTVLHVWR